MTMWCDDFGQFPDQGIVCLCALVQIQSPDEENYGQQSRHMISLALERVDSNG